MGPPEHLNFRMINLLTPGIIRNSIILIIEEWFLEVDHYYSLILFPCYKAPHIIRIRIKNY